MIATVRISSGWSPCSDVPSCDCPEQCWVVAPSETPRRGRDRIKTDRRDSLKLASLARAGELTPIYVPDADDEAMRDLVRAREDMVVMQRQVRQRLGALLLRNDIRYAGKTAWTEAHRCHRRSDSRVNWSG